MSHALIIIKYNSKNLKIDNYFKFQKLFLIPFLTINILIHELQFFFVSIHVLLSYVFYDKKINPFFKSKIFKIYLLLLIPFLLILFNLSCGKQHFFIYCLYSIYLFPTLQSGAVRFLCCSSFPVALLLLLRPLLCPHIA